MLASGVITTRCFGLRRHSRLISLAYRPNPKCKRTSVFCLRFFRSGARCRENDARASKMVSGPSLQPPKSEAAARARTLLPDDRTQNDARNSDRTASAKEQRRADWRILREMAVYLWPKVCSCLACLWVISSEKTSGRPRSAIPRCDVHWLAYRRKGDDVISLLSGKRLTPQMVGAKRTDPFLLQEHHRLHEY